MNNLSKKTYNTAIERCKITATRDSKEQHQEAVVSLLEEIKEFSWASEVRVSSHLPGYTEAQEELADILITCLTELHRRGTDIEKIVSEKVKFNFTRGNIECYTTKELVSFGNYLLSKERDESISAPEMKSVVGDWDVRNWENKSKIKL